MLKDIDRVQLLVPDAADAAARWKVLLGAEEAGNDAVATLGAKRKTLRLGTSCVELLEPDGTGLAESALKARGRAHMFAAGISTTDLAGLEQRLSAGDAEVQAEAGQLHVCLQVEGVPVRFVISPDEEREQVGDASFLYEATLLVQDEPGAVKLFVDTFGLDDAGFEHISSDNFGYTGTLTLFDPRRLHRFEVISPTDADKTMGRYFAKEGVCYYMAFCESAHMLDIEARARAHNAGHTLDRPDGRGADKTADQMWLHPPALGGMMLGISRPSMAWSWSGHPDRVEDVA